MEVSILSKGESLASTWPKMGVGAVTVAVNQAIVAAPNVDWLCMLDVHVLEEPKLRPDIKPMAGLSPGYGVFTAEKNMACAQRLWPHKLIVGSDRIQRLGHDRMPNTGMAALWFATQVLGAKVLHLHGYDLCGRNILGDEESIERGARRWPSERTVLSNVCNALRANGCVIHSYGAFKP